MFTNVKIENPKLVRHSGKNLNYYAGYNECFVDKILKTSDISSDSIIFDPWNGIGTTTTISNSNGFRSVGTDLNPVMLICARAGLITNTDFDSLHTLTAELINKLKISKLEYEVEFGDPLLTWITPQSLRIIRQLNLEINQLLVNEKSSDRLLNYENISNFAAFFYLCCFQTLRILTNKFKSSNPTWIKKPKDPRTRIRPSRETVIAIFEAVSNSLIESHRKSPKVIHSNLTELKIADSASTGLERKSVDLIITSPPYCTRIDYAVSTQIELSFLFFDKLKLKDLRTKMIGTSTINKISFESTNKFGEKVSEFLDKIESHESKSSSSYYYKSHFQYYQSMFNSFSHLSSDVLKENGGIVSVVQDSYYKEIHNDLQSNLIDMASVIGLKLTNRVDFENRRSFASLNPESKKYKLNKAPIESVLCFQKS